MNTFGCLEMALYLIYNSEKKQKVMGGISEKHFLYNLDSEIKYVILNRALLHGSVAKM